MKSNRKKYIVQDAGSGNAIDEYKSLEEAVEAVELMEYFDRDAGIYRPDKYEIRHGDTVVVPA